MADEPIDPAPWDTPEKRQVRYAISWEYYLGTCPPWVARAIRAMREARRLAEPGPGPAPESWRDRPPML